MANKHEKMVNVNSHQEKENLKHKFEFTGMTIIKKQVIPSVVENVEKLELWYITSGNVKLGSHFRKWTDISSSGYT